MGQSKLKGKLKDIAPIEKFTFLIEGENFWAASTTRYEQMDILIGIDFEETRWRELLAELDTVLEAYPKLNFFRIDEELMEEYVGPCLIGQGRFNKFHQHIKECFKFKNEKTIDEPTNICSKEPLGLKKEDLEREVQNIKNRFKAINVNWTPEQVKTSVEAKNILFEFCNYYNDFSMIYEIIGDQMLTAMEQLSDGNYPEVLLGEMTRDCNISMNGDGEKYTVLKCTKTNKGYRCQVLITQATNLKEYTKLHAVHYENVRLMGYENNDIFVKTSDVHELKYLDCENKESGDFAICTEHEVPEICRKMLGKQEIRGIIDSCNFTKGTPQVGTLIPHGGILIQGDKVSISSGKTAISQQPPLVIYSPETITIKREEEDYVYPPAITIEELIVVGSMLSMEDIAYLTGKQYWEDVWEDMDYEDIISYTLVALQIIFIPIAIGSCYLAITQKRGINKILNQGKGRGKDNYKQNQYLLRKI
jgi:hypothetical protein